jgi:hypothetical protein
MAFMATLCCNATLPLQASSLRRTPKTRKEMSLEPDRCEKSAIRAHFEV